MPRLVISTFKVNERYCEFRIVVTSSDIFNLPMASKHYNNMFLVKIHFKLSLYKLDKLILLLLSKLKLNFTN